MSSVASRAPSSSVGLGNRSRHAAALRPSHPCGKQMRHHRLVVLSSEPTTSTELENPDSEASRKKSAAEKLRAAEKFMVIGKGNATCKALPDDYVCPICGAAKDKFESSLTVVAGFAANQRYGLGSNSMTEAQKSLLIYGALGTFFLLFILGYALN
ncbi:hypothetical protein QJQ45_017492 [Haematococcus lacustris]|nr:hypothetical protein QJQ45_017492 [Haematococcus lacustris]